MTGEIEEKCIKETAYPWTTYSNRSAALEYLRHAKIHVDTVLVTHDGERLYVHWQIMSAVCPHFALKLAEISHEESEISADDHTQPSILRIFRVSSDISGKILKAIISCAYTGTVELDKNSLNELFSFAKHYKIKELMSACLTYMSQHVNTTNCVSLFLLGRNYNHALWTAARSMMIRQFRNFMSCNREMYRLPCAAMVSILRDDYLEVRGDEQLVWTAICCWFGVEAGNLDQNYRRPNEIFSPRAPIDNDNNNKLNHKINYDLTFERNLINLLCCIRYECVKDIRIFEHIHNHELLKNSKNARKLIVSMRDRYASRFRQSSDHGTQSRATGLLSHSLFERTIQQLTQWFRLNRTNESSQNPILINNQIEHKSTFHANSEPYERRPRIPSTITLVFGGWSHGRASRSIWSHDPARDKWYKLSIHMSEARAYHASAVLNNTMSNEIFVVGGTNGRGYLSTCVSFNVHRGLECTQRASMREPRCFLSLVPLNNQLFAIGGHDGVTRLRSGERYIPELDSWQQISDMTIARSDASACECSSRIFIAGGQITDQFIQSSVEFYSPRDDSWTFVTPMQVPRMSFRLISLTDRSILAIGGTNGHGFTRTVEKYSVRQSIWSLHPPLKHKRSSFGVIHSRPSDGISVAVIGGYNGRKILSNCESFNWKTISWEKKTKFRSPRSGFATCTSNNLINARDYTF